MSKQKLYTGLIGAALMLGLTLSNPAMAGKKRERVGIARGGFKDLQGGLSERQEGRVGTQESAYW